MSVRLGLWGARCDNSGLGQQTYEFYLHMKPSKTVVVDISVLERTPQRIMKQYPERYPDAKFIWGIPQDADIREFLQDLDVVFIAESSYNMDFYRIAKDVGVKVANQYNYEFFDWVIHPQYTLPDLFIAPSKWNYDLVDKFCAEKGIGHTYLHCPVNRTKIKFRPIDEIKGFVHIAGRPAAHDRNGTDTFLDAVALGNGAIKARVYTQSQEQADQIARDYPKVRVIMGTEDYRDIYKKGEVLVLPRKYGGNCLPLNEALSAGMPVIMPDISPNNEFLPAEWLVEARETDIEFVPRVRIPVYEISPHALFLKMMWFQSLSPGEIIENNVQANYLASEISWETMKPKYEETFEKLCHQSQSFVPSLV